jgi:hypothetical protein
MEHKSISCRKRERTANADPPSSIVIVFSTDCFCLAREDCAAGRFVTVHFSEFDHSTSRTEKSVEKNRVTNQKAIQS